MKAYLECSYLKRHTFGRDQAIYIKQPKVLAMHMKACINAFKTSWAFTHKVALFLDQRKPWVRGCGDQGKAKKQRCKEANNVKHKGSRFIGKRFFLVSFSKGRAEK